jgi:hypothetical protein
MTAELVQLHEDPTLLNDIPNQLRNFASRLERGEETATAVLLLVPGADNEWPTAYNWGAYIENYRLVGLLEIAKIHAVDMMRTPE